MRVAIVLFALSAWQNHFGSLRCQGFQLQPFSHVSHDAVVKRNMIGVSSEPDQEAPLAQEGEVPMNTPARQSLPDHLELRPIPGKGLGVITKVPIACHSVVGDYVGEVITTQVKDRRYLDVQKHLRDAHDVEWETSRIERGQTVSGDYLYGVTMPGGADPIYIDAEDEYESLWTRFLNHASPPDNNVNPKSIHESYDGKPRVWFVANRDIQVGEELCFDYGDDYWLPGESVY